MQNIFDGTYTPKYSGQVLFEISKQIRRLAQTDNVVR